MGKVKDINKLIKDNSDVIMAFVVVGIVLMIIIPLPTQFLDILIVFNITIAMIILLLTLFTTSVLQFSVFPTLLLITTLFRLGLNVSSTRLILTQHSAGKVIEAFGNAVVKGSYVVGIIIFLIIVIIQFIVITSGSQRVAEVSARFTLDAMPGKQMAIDADLNAGVINEAQAKQKKNDLQMEADFYGAMDGASKFVKGDAIAALIIVFINILGGIIIGVVMDGMPLTNALQTYTKLSIGDGLVSQLPALLISTASGILVTRSKGQGNKGFGSLVISQLTFFPKVIGVTSVILFLIAIVPGFPTVPFLALGIITGICAYSLVKEDKKKKVVQEEVETRKITEKETRAPENVMNLISVDPMEVEIGYGLIPLADEAAGGDLLQRIASVRRQCAIDMGIVVQPIRIRDNLQLKTNEYVIKIRGTTVAKSDLMPSMLLCMNPSGEDMNISGIKTREPSFDLPAVWINKDQRENAEIKGFTVVDPTTVMVTHLTETIKAHSYELLGRQEVKEIIDSLKEKYSAVIGELIPDLMTLGEVQKVLQNLLRERIPIKDMATILESLADNSRSTKDIELLTEYVRIALGRSICSRLIDDDSCMTVVTLSPKLEELIASNIQKSIRGSFPAINPDSTAKIFNSLKKIVKSINFYGNQPIILTSPKIRPAFKRFTEMIFPEINVLSLNEIPNDIRIKTEGVVNI